MASLRGTVPSRHSEARGGVVTNDEREGTVSRRALLGGAGAVVVGGLVAGTDTAAFAHGASKHDDGAVASGIPNTTVAEFRARIAQRGASGEDFTSVGYVTRLAGAHD